MKLFGWIFERSRFERVSKYPDAELPVRSTAFSAGYDLFCAEDTTVNPHDIALIPTGVKCYLPNNCWLLVALRSSTPRKLGLILANGIGIIDPDYVDNPETEGQIFIQVYNLRNSPITIKKGDRIAQGLKMPLSIFDKDINTGKQRVGGFGSTN